MQLTRYRRVDRAVRAVPGIPPQALGKGRFLASAARAFSALTSSR